jgi:hypothetical protein
MNSVFDALQSSADARLCDLRRDADLARVVKRNWAFTRLLPRRSWKFHLLGEPILELQR